jgi:hypothetical protein
MKSSKGAVWAARAMWGIAVLFLALDGIGKLFLPSAVVEGSARLGYTGSTVLAIGIIELACLALYVIPRTAVFGALLLTAYLGGAVATHVRIGDPLFSHILFPTYVAMLLWAPLAIRDSRVRQLLTVRRPATSAPAANLSQEFQL